MKTAIDLKIEIDEHLAEADAALESWAKYREEVNQFLVRVAENAGEDLLISQALNAGLAERGLLTIAKRERRRAARKARKYNQLFAKQVAREAELEKTVWPEFGKNVEELDRPSLIKHQ